MFKKHAIFSFLFLLCFSFFDHSVALAQLKESTIEVKASLTTAMSSLYGPEAIVVAESGDKFVFVASKSKPFLPVPPSTAWLCKRDPATGIWGKPEQLIDKGLCLGIAFGNSDKWIIASQAYFKITGLRNLAYIADREKIGNLKGFKHRLEIIDAETRKEVMTFSPADFGLKKNEIIKHARISPDGKWLSFYLHAYKEQVGIYLYNFATKKTFHLALMDDKHPTWSPDGTKIFFHYQKGGDAVSDEKLDLEEARLGYYDLKFYGDSATWKRILIDPADGPAVYHKHPSMYSGADLVFFHKKHREDKNGKIELSSSELYVRRLGISTPVYHITGLNTSDSIEVNTIKHATSAATIKLRSGLFFVGKGKEKSTDKSSEFKIYHLADKDVQNIAAEISKIESAK